MPFTFLNQNDKQATTLASNNLTWTATASGGVRAVDPQTTGKFYFEVAWSHATSADSGCGLAKSTATFNGLISNASNGVITYHGFGIFNNGTSTGVNPGAINSGSTVGIAVDLGGSLIWFTLDGTHWNSTSSATNNPATGVGGVSISGITGGNLYPVVINNAAVEAGTTNFGASAFTYSVPSGFTSGWPGVGPLANLPTPGPITMMQKIGPSYDDDQLSQEWSPLERVRNFRTKWLLNVGRLEISKFVDYNVLMPPVAVNVSKFVEFVVLNYLPVPQLPTGVSLLRRQASEWDEIDNQKRPAPRAWFILGASNASPSITGVAATGQVGSLTVTTGSSVAVTGVQATAQTGALGVEIDKGITGVAATGAVGSLTPDVEPNITGVAATTQIGAFNFGQSTSFIGVQAAALIGDLLVSTGTNTTQANLTGVGATAHVGSFTFAHTNSFEGVQANTEVGTPTVNISAGGLTMTHLTVETVPGFDAPAYVSMRYSNTKGASWSFPVRQPLGAPGNYNTNVQFRQNSASRDRIYDVSWGTGQATALTGLMVELIESET